MKGGRKNKMIEQIKHGEMVLAVIIPRDYQAEGLQFLTPDEYSQQLAYMHHPTGKKIDAHVHNEVHRSIYYTQEVLVIRKGRLRVDLYTENREYVKSRILSAGDIILLVSGGHGFEVIEEVEMIEVKQGPYAGNNDKTRFEGVETDKLKIERPL